jgi:hypothetical protein
MRGIKLSADAMARVTELSAAAREVHCGAGLAAREFTGMLPGGMQVHCQGVPLW